MYKNPPEGGGGSIASSRSIFHSVRDQCDLTAHPGVQFGIFKLANNRIEEFVLLCLIYILYKHIM